MRVYLLDIVLLEECYRMKDKMQAVPAWKGSLHSRKGMLKNVQDIFSNQTGFV